MNFAWRAFAPLAPLCQPVFHCRWAIFESGVANIVAPAGRPLIEAAECLEEPGVAAEILWWGN
jgi:hypothetical protein